LSGSAAPSSAGQAPPPPSSGAPAPTPVDADAKISHLKCPIGQTLAKSLEKWTSNLRTYNSCRFSNPMSKSVVPELVLLRNSHVLSTEKFSLSCPNSDRYLAPVRASSRRRANRSAVAPTGDGFSPRDQLLRTVRSDRHSGFESCCCTSGSDIEEAQVRITAGTAGRASQPPSRPGRPGARPHRYRV
jgi:hypothetical protein